MSRRRRRTNQAEQRAVPTPSAPKPPSGSNPHPIKPPKPYIARRAKPSVVPGHVKLTLTLDMRRDLAERLSARAIRDGVNLEAAVI